MEQENLYNKIQELLGNLRGNFNILEEQIDIDVQMEYFELSKDSKKTLDIERTLNIQDSLFSEDFSLEQKKKLIVKLACIDKVEAFRILERYRKNPDPELKDWAALAMQESKMLLESSLLDENQVFISTGLGGKGLKLRYFIVFLTKGNITLSDLQKKIVNTEVNFVFKKYGAEIEKINFSNNFATIKTIIPIQVQLNEMFEQTIENCNQFGDFLQINFIVTNVKELSIEEITQVLETSKFPGNEEMK